MATTTTAKTNYRYLTAKTITYGLALGAMVISYTHIVHLFNMLGLAGWQSYVAPAFIDGFVLLGILGRGEQFAESTRRTGLRLQIGGTLVSLAANVGAGDSRGAQIFGVLIVLGYLIAEWYADQLKPAATTAETTAAKRSAASRKAAETRRANADREQLAAAAKSQAAKARKARRAQAVTVDALPVDTRAYV